MTEAEKRTTIRNIVREFAAEVREPEPTESLFESGLIDSFVLPQLVTALEEAFHIRIPDSDLNPRQFESLAKIEAYLSGRAK